MADFNKAFDKTMGHEGGYVYDPDDAGGETYRGIARKYNPQWRGWETIDKTRPNIPNNELNTLVRNFYKVGYWDVNKLDNFPQSVANEMFDTGVNMGTGRAAKFLQKSLNYLNRNESLFASLVVDGKIGPASMKALAKCTGDESVLLAMMNTLQGQHYMNYMDSNPVQKKYARGWFKRVIYCECK
jgi:lysozyme family protein